MKAKEVWDGEPVAIIAGILVSIASLAGVVWTEGQVQAVIVALAPLVGAVLARTKTTPSANPTVPTVKVENAQGQPVEVPKTADTPVWTFPQGRRNGGHDDE